MRLIFDRPGMIAVITKEVTQSAVNSLLPMFNKLRNSAPPTKQRRQQLLPCDPTTYDWALHPGGAAILNGAQQSLHLDDDHLRASRDVYQNHGNSSSVTVLIVLDRLRQMGRGRDNVVAASFGPGMMIEMCMMKRWRGQAIVRKIPSRVVSFSKWLSIKGMMAGCLRWSSSLRTMGGVTPKSSGGNLGL